LPFFRSYRVRIYTIEFLYLDSNDVVAATPGDIRSVRISLLARANRPDQNFTNGLTYCPGSNPYDVATGTCEEPNPALATIWGPYNDNFRRRLLITTIQCRNMGL